MDNYYERLEVSPKASPEIIEKAYRVLAKRYHPDMHEEAKKEWAEAEFKKINEAYEVLSNDEKRKEYDLQLEENKEEEYKELVQEIEQLKAELEEYKKQDSETYQNIQKQPEMEYTDTDTNQTTEKDTIYNYYNNLKNNYHKYYSQQYNNTSNYNYQKEDWLKTKIKGILSILLTIIIVLAISYLLWIIPFTRSWLQGIYNENEGIKMIVDIFIK